MKRQTKIKNKSIKVKRRLGGSMYSTTTDTDKFEQPSADKTTVNKAFACVKAGESNGPLGYCKFSIGRRK